MNVIKLDSVSKHKGISSTTYKASPKKTSVVDSTSFLAESLHKEVMSQERLSGRNRKIKSLKRLHKGFMSILVTAMVASPASTSAQINSIHTNMMNNTGNEQDITPQLIMQWGFTVGLVVVAIGVSISLSLLVIAGVYRTLRKKEAVDWTTDIIKGLIQILIAIPIVYSLFYLAQIVFRRIPFLEGLL